MRPLGYIRLLTAQYRFFPHYVRHGSGLLKLALDSYYMRLAELRNKYIGQRCFVIANGPSLNKLDMTKLKNEITIGCNGIYKKFSDWGFQTTFIVTEDMEQTELRASDIEWLKGITKLAGLHNAYAFRMKSDMLYFNAGARCSEAYWRDLYPRFSDDFASVVYMGGSVTYIMLQLAYHLGCNPVYLIGLDFSYGALSKLFPPGKIMITKENVHLVRGLHVDPDYYKLGDQIGVPYSDKQYAAYRKVLEFYSNHDRLIYNAGVDSQLDVFPFKNYDTLF